MAGGTGCHGQGAWEGSSHFFSPCSKLPAMLMQVSQAHWGGRKKLLLGPNPALAGASLGVFSRGFHGSVIWSSVFFFSLGSQPLNPCGWSHVQDYCVQLERDKEIVYWGMLLLIAGSQLLPSFSVVKWHGGVVVKSEKRTSGDVFMAVCTFDHRVRE